MVEATLQIRQYSNNKVTIDATEITGEGAPTFPRIIVPLKMKLSPLGDENQKKEFVILGIASALFIQDTQQKITVSSSPTYPYRVSNNYEITSRLEFGLSPDRLQIVEAQRGGGDLNLRFDLWFTLGLFDSVQVNDGANQRTLKFLSDIEYSAVQLSNVKIPQSHWVKNILPHLGSTQYFLVEVPKGDKAIAKSWQYVERAEEAFGRWDTKGVLSNCREVGKVLDTTVKGQYGEGFTYKERWGRAFKVFTHLCSLGLHLEDKSQEEAFSGQEVKITRADAELVLVLTKALMKFAEELMKERG